MWYWEDPFPTGLWYPLSLYQDDLEDSLPLTVMGYPWLINDEQAANVFFSYVSYGGLMAVRGVPPIEGFYPTEETFPQEYFSEQEMILSTEDTYDLREAFLANTHGCWVGGI